jgi:hypothetical protein
MSHLLEAMQTHHAKGSFDVLSPYANAEKPPYTTDVYSNHVGYPWNRSGFLVAKDAKEGGLYRCEHLGGSDDIGREER